MSVLSIVRYYYCMAIKREMPERNELKVSQETEEKVGETVARLRAEGFKFDFEETPDTYVVTTTDKNGDSRSTHFMKLVGGKLPSGFESFGVEEFIEAHLRYPEDDINIAVRKLKEEK